MLDEQTVTWLSVGWTHYYTWSYQCVHPTLCVFIQLFLKLHLLLKVLRREIERVIRKISYFIWPIYLGKSHTWVSHFSRMYCEISRVETSSSDSSWAHTFYQFILIHMCSHTGVCVYWYICVLIDIYVSSYWSCDLTFSLSHDPTFFLHPHPMGIGGSKPPSVIRPLGCRQISRGIRDRTPPVVNPKTDRTSVHFIVVSCHMLFIEMTSPMSLYHSLSPIPNTL
jgi:hypothetical protein